MNLKLNVAATYASQIYITLIGITILPLYIRFLGTESYGLIGFFTTLQACFTLLDVGLTPTISRQSAQYHSNSISRKTFDKIYKIASCLFYVLALIIGFLGFVFSKNIAGQWLDSASLAPENVSFTLKIMLLCLIFRWVSGLYRGVIIGFERLPWLSFFNVLVSTLKFIGVFASFEIFGYDILVFFYHQLLVAFLEFIILFAFSRKVLCLHNEKCLKEYSFEEINFLALVKFSLSIALTSSIWVLVTQLDKIILSGLLTLSDYGYYSIGVLLASAIILITAPVGTALMPRLAYLYASGKNQELRDLYRKATKFVSLISAIITSILFFNAENILLAWTGDKMIVESSSSTLRLYAIGNLFLSLSSFAYYLQFAYGKMKFHLIGNIILLFLIVPVLVYSVIEFGVVGAGFTWLLVNFLYLFIWVTYVHKNMLTGGYLKWLFNDCLYPWLIPFFIGGLIYSFEFNVQSRLYIFIYLVFISLVILIISILSNKEYRSFIFGTLNNYKALSEKN